MGRDNQENGRERGALTAVEHHRVLVHAGSALAIAVTAALVWQPALWLVAAALVLPALGLALSIWSSLEQRRLGASSRGPRMLLWTYSLPTLGLLLRATSYDFVSGQGVVLVTVPFVMTTLLLVPVFVDAEYRAIYRASKRSGAGAMAALLIASLGYFYGAVVLIDTMTDGAPPRAYRALVSAKDTERHTHRRGSSTDYYLTLTDWTPDYPVQKWDVSESLYDAARVGAHLCLLMHPGALGLAWYTYRLC